MEYVINEVAVCNLASIALNKFVDETASSITRSYTKSQRWLRATWTRLLMWTITLFPKLAKSNMRHRPIGIGVQVWPMPSSWCMRMLLIRPSEGHEHRHSWNHLLRAAMGSFDGVAKKDGAYETFKGSPVSKGIFNLICGVEPKSNRWDWNKLKNVKQHGVRATRYRSLLCCFNLADHRATTSASSHILQTCTRAEHCQAISRRVNKHLMKDFDPTRFVEWNHAPETD